MRTIFFRCFSAVGPTFIFILSDIHNSIMIPIFLLVYYRNRTCLCFSFVWWLLFLVCFFVFFKCAGNFCCVFPWKKDYSFCPRFFSQGNQSLIFPFLFFDLGFLYPFTLGAFLTFNIQCINVFPLLR